MPFKIIFLCLIVLLTASISFAQTRPRVREVGLKIGILPTGKQNSITDVEGVLVGHSTIIQSENIRTGVTAILPHNGNLFREKVPAAIFVGNGFGKLAGSTQVNELGEIETPILLTSTLAVPRVGDFLLDYMLGLSGNENVQSINPVVAETNDGFLNDIRARQITQADVFNAVKNAKNEVEEGAVGAGTGTVAFGWKGGIGTSSRKIGDYTVGVLVQTNFGGVLSIDGAPVGVELGKYYLKDEVEKNQKTVSQSPTEINDWADGSVIIVIATDAPVDARQLKRMASRAMSGLARTGSAMTNGSGDYAIAFSTNNRIKPLENGQNTRNVTLLSNDAMSPLFLATIEATEEAILNSLFKATTVKGRESRTVEALPIDKTLEILRKYNKIK
ncbi:MAG: P1 family peptidase [Pyrinomonadaceae bacterium]|nr:P1 family peptidase [Pyrinomonadaceae bacterium]